MTKLDVKLAATWLSEAGGEDIPQSHIRVRRGWLFVRYPNYIDDLASLNDPTWEGLGYRKIRKGWDNEVECVEAPILHTTQSGMVISNDIYAEPWSAIQYQNSPFVPHNHSRVNAVIERLNFDLDAYRKEYCDDEEEV